MATSIAEGNTLDTWSNPYADFQRTLRARLKERLRRTNGVLTQEQFSMCEVPGRGDGASKVRLRLLTTRADGALEWKPELVSEAVLHRKVGGSTSIDLPRLTTLWETSRRIENRTEFPFLAPVSNRSQHVSMDDWNRKPVFGVDALVRPPTQFSEDREAAELRNELVLGDESFAVVAHGNMLDGQLVNDGKYFARLVIGRRFDIPRIGALIPATAQRCELAMFAPLLLGDADAVVDAILPHLSRFAADAYRALLS